MRGGAFSLAKILRILARKNGNFNDFGRIGDFLFLRATSIFSFFQIFAIIKVNPIRYASRFLLQPNRCNPEGATSVNFAKAGLGSQGCPFGL